MKSGFLFLRLRQQGLTFTETNIKGLQQINCLSLLRRLEHLNISNEGNPITSFTLWKPYVLFRLAHFSLRKINDVEVSLDYTRLLSWTWTQKSCMCEKVLVFFSCRPLSCLVLIHFRVTPTPPPLAPYCLNMYQHISFALFSVTKIWL